MSNNRPATPQDTKDGLGRWWKTGILALLLILVWSNRDWVSTIRHDIKLNPEAWEHRPDARAVGAVMKSEYQAMIEHKEKALWNGVWTMQFPPDLVLYQRLMHEHRPDLVIETGTAYGGLTLFLASVAATGNLPTRIVTVDIEDTWWKETLNKGSFDRTLLDRITFLKGSSTGADVSGKIREMASTGSVMVILDSLHTREHVLDELRLYAPLVRPGGYVMVNDTTLGGLFWNGKGWLQKVGPLYGVKDFLKENREFELADHEIISGASCMFSGILRRSKGN